MQTARGEGGLQTSRSNRLWQVQLSADDVQALTREKIDELYRLGIVDDATRVRRPGMIDWLPFGSVKESGPDREVPFSDVRDLKQTARVDSGTPSWASLLPPALPFHAKGWSDTLAPPTMSDGLSDDRKAYGSGKRAQASRLERTLLGLTYAVGLVVILYRNDLLRRAARAVGHEGWVLKIEQTFGGPGFGTPRAVEQMAKPVRAR